MPRAKKIAPFTVETAVTDKKDKKLNAAESTAHTLTEPEKTKRGRSKNTEKIEEALPNGSSKGRGGKKTKIDNDNENLNPREQLSKSQSEKMEQAPKGKPYRKEKAEEDSVENGNLFATEDLKPKRGRGKKATEENGAKTKQDASIVSTGSVSNAKLVVIEKSKTKAVRSSKKLQAYGAADQPQEIEAKPSTSAAARGRKRKGESAEPAVDAVKPESVPKTTARGKKRSPDEASEASTLGSKTAKKELEPVKKKKITKAKDIKPVDEEIAVDTAGLSTNEKPAKTLTVRKRGAAKTVNDKANEQTESSKPKKALLNPTETTYSKADFELTDADKDSSNVSNNSVERKQLKISSWNVAGLRSWLKKGGLKFLEFEEPDIFCLQETKCTVDQMPEEAQRIPGYHPYFLCLPGGYAGVALYSKIMPINVEYGIGNDEFDDAGRLITAEYEKFFLLNVYVPNSGRKLVNLEARMRWEKLFQEYVKKFDARKPVIVCGDMNVSHQEIDLANPKSNTRSAGFTIEEREKMTELLSLGLLDTFRQLYPKKIGAYTYWTYMANARSRNVGWRLDYFLVSERIGKRVVENAIRSQVLGLKSLNPKTEDYNGVVKLMKALNSEGVGLSQETVILSKESLRTKTPHCFY